MNFYELTPYDFDGNVGRAYNKSCSLVPNDNDWIMLTDQDSMILTLKYGHKIQQYIKKYPDVVLFTCMSNRINNPHQREKGMYHITDIKEHRKKAIELDKQGLELKYTRRTISGYMMLFQKKTWMKYGFRERGFYGIDTYFSADILKHKEPVGIMKNVYALHYYRFLEGTKKDKKNGI